MKLVHFDLVGGASGDLLLGALISIGADADAINAALASLAVEPIHLHVEPAEQKGIHGIRVTMHTHEMPHGTDHTHHHDHSHHHQDHAASNHSPTHSHQHTHEGHAPHRNLNDIQGIVHAATLPEPVKAMALDVFNRIAKAEAKIHGTTVDQIHFHEVGALDSIADIVGCCLGLHLLGIDAVSFSPLPAGHGTIECAHGTYPNPAPATVELAHGLPVVSVDEPSEMVTPTGAALLAAWKTHDAPPAGARSLRAGYSMGQRQMKQRPNVVRAILYEVEPAHATDGIPDPCLKIECNLDDCTPEIVGGLVEQLLNAGALDVFTQPCYMKKQRIGTQLTILCRSGHREALLDIVFTESTTFGVRESEVQRTTLRREMIDIHIAEGQVPVKVGYWKDSAVTISPEFDACQALARATGRSVRAIYLSAQQAAHARLSQTSPQ